MACDASFEQGASDGKAHITTLSRKKYPGNRHWHFKEATKSKGCLDVTFWPEGSLFWITVRKQGIRGCAPTWAPTFWRDHHANGASGATVQRYGVNLQLALANFRKFI